MSQQKSYFNPDIRILVCRKDLLTNWRHPALAAPFWRIYHASSPGGRITSGERVYELTPERVLLISPDTPFQSDNDCRFTQLYIHFQARAPYELCPGIIMEWRRDEALLSQIADISACLDLPEADEITLSMKTLLLIHTLLLRIPPERLRHPDFDVRVQTVIDWIEHNYAQPVNNRTLGKIAGMNANAFARLFKEQAGMSPQRFLCHRRVNEACLRLRFSRSSIEEIAAATGFCDRHYFTRVFTKMRCMSPAAFRKHIH